MEKDFYNQIIKLLEDGKIINTIKLTEGWYSPDRDNSIFKLHELLKNTFFNRAFEKVSINDRKKLLSKLNHKTHFTEGVSKSKAVEYYYLCLDAYEENGYIKGLGKSVKMTKEMKSYYHKIYETVEEFKENKTLLNKMVKHIECLIALMSFNQLASVLQTYHTSSMGYRVWHNLNDKLECKTTYWGTEQQMLTYINYANAVRVDHWIIDSQSWVTIWLTSMEFLSLKEGEAA